MSQPHDVSPTASQLGDCLTQAAESQRQLFQEMANFTRDETSRFVNLRLERNGQVLEKIQNCHGLQGLIGVQQEWLRSFMEDYMSQQMRLAGAFRGLAHDVMTTAAETASENIDRMQQDGREMAETVDRHVNQTVQDASTYVQETHH